MVISNLFLKSFNIVQKPIYDVIDWWRSAENKAPTN